MQETLRRLLEYFYTNWKFLALILTFSLAISLVRRFRLSRQNTEVSTAMRDVGFLPLDKLPIDRDELKCLAPPVGLGKVHNIVGGSVGGNEVVLFDTEVSDRDRLVALQTNAAFRLTSSNTPDFSLQPKSVLGSALSMLGKGIDFGDDSEFSRDYFLTSADEARVRASFTPEFQTFFEGLERFDSKKNWHMQKHGDWVLLYRKREGFKPDELQTFLEATAEIVRALEGGPSGPTKDIGG